MSRSSVTDFMTPSMTLMLLASVRSFSGQRVGGPCDDSKHQDIHMFVILDPLTHLERPRRGGARA